MFFIKTFLILIILIFNSSANGLNNEKLKCCPPQEIFSIKESSRCFISYKENSPGYYDAKNEDWEVKYLKECFNVTSQKSSFNSTIASSITCIDLLRNKDFLDASFIYDCKQDSLNNEASQLMNIRKCCPTGQRYDTQIRECIEFTSDNSSILNVLNSFDFNVNFLSIIKGFPICKYSIIDYTISRDDQLSFDNDTIEISISSNTRFSEISINEDNSCLDFGSSEDTLVLRTCSNSEYCNQNVCLRKCCPEDEAWIDHKCQKISSFGDSMYPITPDEKWSITSRGHIYVPKQETYNLDEYCLEIIYASKDYSEGLYPCLCFNEYPISNEEISPQRFIVNAVLELISCTFLLLTFLVYLCLPLLQNLHGKTLMCHLASLFIAFACHATITLSSLQDSTDCEFMVDRPMCKPLGYAMAVSFLASFSWLSIICFDIWWTFGLILNIKLFVLMGISWIFEIISYVINHCAPDLSWRVELFYAFDVLNCLRGLVIFLLFVLKNKVSIALMHRLGRRKINAPINQKAVNLQEPYKMAKYTSCSTLMSSTVDPTNAQT
ncbi:hypothetical protein G9C98_005076 [Cotesia typhae]|uniref:Uncharacterized protein n=1 Tax=Cotesia typhae TaxID=2053667 RepID=A0A8J5R9W8_9HYME|nr:hypothetical protein G9C98_005076 [Cotesia typhae]